MENKKFTDLGLSKEVLRAVEEMGYEEATTIQSQCIPALMEGRDVTGQSQTGTGKTAAFAIPAIERTVAGMRAVQTLVLCPTRELAMQACEEFGKFARFKRGVRALAIYGGAPMDRQVRALKAGVQVVIGTPGRVMDHMRRGTLKLTKLATVVLDEADEMLNMGFIDDIETILQGIPEEHQTVLFSATMPQEILDIARRYQKDPVLVKVAHRQLTVEGIKQVYYEAPRGRKLEVLTKLLDVLDPNRAIVFCNTKRQVDELTQQLVLRGYQAQGLHGDMKQTVRSRVMGLFKKGKTDILIATDVAARGIDVEDIDVVFNYDLPQDVEYYVHRIGRTGRAGRTGLAVSLVSGFKEISELRNIQRYTKGKIIHKAVPSSAEVLLRRQASFVESVRQAVSERDVSPYTELVEQIMEDLDCTAVDVAAAVIGILFGNDERAAKVDGGCIANDTVIKLFINAGRDKRIAKGDIVGALAALTGVPGGEIGAIEVLDKHSFVEVPGEYVDNILKVMNGKTGRIKGIDVNVELAES